MKSLTQLIYAFNKEAIMKMITRFILLLLLMLLLAAGCSSNEDSEIKNAETLEYDEISHLKQTSLGNNSAIINTVSALGGGDIPHKIEITSDTLQINYDLAAYDQENEENAEYWYNTGNQERNAGLNSAILFALVENLTQLEISFNGETTEEYTINRDELASTLNTSFESLDEESYKKYKAAFAKD
jgi:uncharacterized protein YcfL